MLNDTTAQRWATYLQSSKYSGLSTRLLEELVKDCVINSSLARRPGRARGIRLIDLRSLDTYIETGIGAKTDMSPLDSSSKESKKVG
jgi:hypothetical protein